MSQRPRPHKPAGLSCQALHAVCSWHADVARGACCDSPQHTTAVNGDGIGLCRVTVPAWDQASAFPTAGAHHSAPECHKRRGPGQLLGQWLRRPCDLLLQPRQPAATQMCMRGQRMQPINRHITSHHITGAQEVETAVIYAALQRRAHWVQAVQQYGTGGARQYSSAVQEGRGSTAVRFTQ